MVEHKLEETVAVLGRTPGGTRCDAARPARDLGLVSSFLRKFWNASCDSRRGLQPAAPREKQERLWES
jgi:hypothetical protein